MDTAVEEGSEEAGVGREQETGFARKHLGKVSLVAQEPGSLSGAGRGGGRCHPGWLVESLEDIAKDLSLRFGLCTLGFVPPLLPLGGEWPSLPGMMTLCWSQILASQAMGAAQVKVRVVQ